MIDDGLESVPQLWELDAIGIIPEQPSPDDVCAYNQYLETVQYYDGQYWVRLPWKINHKTLPTNYHMAYSQFKSQLAKLRKRPEHLKLYHEIIAQQLKNKFIEVVKHDNTQTGHFLPHMAVKRESKTTPLRIVFNCSSKSGPQGTSLNDCLQTGPSLTQKLYDILLKFRLNKYAYSADISKAFLRVGLQEEDRDFTKFLWVENPEDVNSPVVTFRFSSVLFGATSSPFLLQATLDTHLKKSSSPCKTEISQNLYVDNFQGTVNSTTELLQLYQEANKELQGANMPLQSWASNNATLNNQIARDYPEYHVPESQKVLGMDWDLISDTISIKSVPVNYNITTKRDLLSQVSKVFDPLGLLNPLTIKWRLLVQEAWKAKVGWDDPLPIQLQKASMEVAQEQTLVEKIIFPRHIVEENEEVSLHVFADSSAKAFGACAYLVTSNQSYLITSKARVAPLKKRTLPQMELTALLTGTRLAVHIKQVLSTMNIKDVIIWSDNEAVLQWVRNDNCPTPYVKNRVSEIKEISAGFQLLHVPTKDNPADLLSRGMTFKQFAKADIWFHGPRWLVNGSWPEQKPHVITTQTITTTRQQAQISVLDCTRYSSLIKLINVTQNVFHYLRKKGIKYTFPDALIYWVRQAQRETYGNNYENLPHKLKHNLGLWIDQENHNILRCGGRLKHADINLDTVHPWLLPKNHWITRLIVLHTHQQIIKHGGVLDTLTQIRQQYWIPQGRQSVKSILKNCMICRRYDARTCSYPGPPPLPKERVVHLQPFETTGVDYTGAIYLTGTADKQPIKAYICLFTCATTRAVHLEVTPDMTAQSFIQAFRRFAARRSCPKLMISDNGANLVAGEACLREICSHPAVTSTLEQRHCRWKFIPPRAPWHGGFYERLIGTVKRSLRKSLHRQKINLQELQTVITEIESRVNNRPLTYLSEDPTQHEPLSPAHLMYGRLLTPVPSLVDDEIRDPSYVGPSELVQGYKHLSSIIQKWNDIWTKEYLTSLREHHYGANVPHNIANLQPGDIVLVDSDGPRADWPLGKVVSVHPDSQGILRIVKILSKGTTSLKTLDKLIHMESVSRLQLDPERPQETLTPQDPQTPNRHNRPQRTAAQKCKQNLHLYYQSNGE
ncbi:uncharacterized protein [Procambarus clarkii]|uniref:uncharacterized protein n=1 Tax=Procambarus clarkii TaxID=6728 RepID=UPI003742E7EA